MPMLPLGPIIVSAAPDGSTLLMPPKHELQTPPGLVGACTGFRVSQQSLGVFGHAVLEQDGEVVEGLFPVMDGQGPLA